MDLKKRERSVYSQAGQDGVIEAIFEVIRPTNKFFVEFGAGDGKHLSNTANLRRNHLWGGLLMDSVVMQRNREIVKCEHVCAENIEVLLRKYLVPASFDYLSIDLDGNDYWVWKAIEIFTPRVVSIEFNSNFGPDTAVTIPYNASHSWDGSKHYGASLAALHKLALSKGYSLVHIVENLDAFFVLNECMAGLTAKSVHALLPEPIPTPFNETNRPWITV